MDSKGQKGQAAAGMKKATEYSLSLCNLDDVLCTDSLANGYHMEAWLGNHKDTVHYKDTKRRNYCVD